MKKIKIAVFFLLISIISNSQPVITEANFPRAGDNFNAYYEISTSWNPGIGGTDVTWDFSGIATDNELPVNYQNPSSTPYGAQFNPVSNIGLYQVLAYIFYNNNSSKSDIAGTTTGFAIRVNTDPQTIFKFPLNYNDEFRDTARTGTYHVSAAPGYNQRRIVYSHTVADGCGTLQLPNASYSNVLRIRVSSHTIDSSFNSGDNSFLSRSVSNDTQYYWISQDHKPHLLTMIKNTSESGEENILIQAIITPSAPNPPLGIQLPDKNLFSLFPNPSTGIVYIESHHASGVAFMELFSFTGNKILTEEIRSSGQKINIENLPPGIYYFRFSSEENILQSGKLIVE